MEGNWKDYFAFTKKERTGILMLIALIAIGLMVPRFFGTTSLKEEVRVEAIQIQKASPEQINKDQGRRTQYHPQQSTDEERYDEPEKQPQAGTLFPFDPNTLNEAGWKKLGINDRTISTIQHYKSKGGRFRNAGDLQKMYGLKKADFDRLAPYIQIAAPAPFVYAEKTPRKYIKPPPAVIDINQADTLAFISLPGIGSKLANRIVHFREKLGGFCSVQQLGETFGLPDSTFQLIKPRLQCSPVDVEKININTADVNALKQHPYIRWNIANAIVQYRQQHGAFHSPDELQQIVLITPELYQKIAAYVTVEN
jgi:competence protein ComEA